MGSLGPHGYSEAGLRLEPERLEPSLRETLSSFFARGLNREPGRRFDNADEMLEAWRSVFSQTESGGP